MNCTPCEKHILNKVEDVEAIIPVTSITPVTEKNITTVPKPPVILSSNSNANHCPANKVTHIGKVDDHIVITMDDCTYYTANLNKLDAPSFARMFLVITDAIARGEDLIFTLTNQLDGKKEEKVVSLPKADNKFYGVIKLATDKDVLEGESTILAMSPKHTLEMILRELNDPSNLPLATELNIGAVKLATLIETLHGFNNVALTPEMAIKLIFQEVNKENVLPLASTTSAGVVVKGIKIKNMNQETLGYLVN